MNQPENAIVVAVGYQGCDAALAFAAQEAVRTQNPLHLVQVTALPDTAEYAGIYSSNVPDLDGPIDKALAQARQLVGESSVAVTGERVEDHSHVAALVRHANRSRMIVLQHRRIGALKRIVTGSTTDGVAGRARVPVVSVPEDWSASHAGSVVTVAVQDAEEAAGLLRVGLEQARARRAALVVLHAWWLASGYDVVVVDDTMRRDWAERAQSSLAHALDELRTEYPDVQVTVQVQHAPPIEAILDATEQSALLVLGRRHHLLPLGSHLGPVARATLSHSACPVLMVPPVPQAQNETSLPFATDRVGSRPGLGWPARRSGALA